MLWAASIRSGMGQFVASMRRKMDVAEQVEAYLASQPGPKQADLRRLHAHMLAEFPGCRLWFTDGANADGKVVANPNIGYGAYTITYADGMSREFYRIGLSANTTGISVYVLGLDDKTYLARTYGRSIGKARVTGYCIKFRHLAVINVDVLQAAIRYGMSAQQAGWPQQMRQPDSRPACCRAQELSSALRQGRALAGSAGGGPGSRAD